jgi:hypothetical protein
MLKLTLLSSLGSSVLHAAEDSDNGFLRRKRIESPTMPIAAEPAMEDIWELAAAAAQVESDAERLLRESSNDFSMSTPHGPTRPPIFHPTPAPHPRPTPAPFPTPTTPPPVGPTAAPVDCLMGRTREEYVFDLLVPITPGHILNDPSTPQGMAFDYLANDDPHLENPCSSSTIEQRYGLTTLYFSTQGGEWLDQEGWLGPDQECIWFGIACHDDPTAVTRLLLSKFHHAGLVVVVCYTTRTNTTFLL